MLLEIRNVIKDYGSRRAVNDVSLSIEKGETFGLLGPNGAGKTTLVSMISCLFPPTSGDIILGGKHVTNDPMGVKRKLGLVPQDIALYPTLSALENLRFWAKMQDVPAKEESLRIDWVLDVIGLKERKKDRVSTFSGGMMRRLNIGAALLHKPELLILDEPTVGVDPQSRTYILDTVAHLAEEGMTVLFTSHYMEEVERLCKRVAVMDEGRVIALGTIPELKKIVGEMDEIVISVGAMVKGSRSQSGSKMSSTAGGPASPQELAHILENDLHIPGVSDARVTDSQIAVFAQDGANVLPELLARLASKGVRIQSIQVKEPTLEGVFFKLTKKALRD